MSDKSVDEVIRKVLAVLGRLQSRAATYQQQANWLEGAGHAYLLQLNKAAKALQEKCAHIVDHAGDDFSEHWRAAYASLLDSLISPELPLAYRGAPAYHLRQCYPALADLCYQLVVLRDDLWACFREGDLGCEDGSGAYYVAPQSRLTWSLWWNWVAKRLFLPFLLLWDVCCSLSNRLLGYFFMRTLVFPGLAVADWREEEGFSMESDMEAYLDGGLPNGWGVRRYHLVDKKMTTACLEVNKLATESETQAKQAVKTIVYFLGNNDIYPMSLQACLDDIAGFAERGVTCRFLLWHYPGVFNSMGSPRRPTDLVRAGLSVVQHLISKGVDPEDLVLKGHSLGGYVATHVAYCCHRLKIWVRLWSDRSLADSPNYMLAKVVTRCDSGYQLRPRLLRAFVYAIYPFAWLLSRLMCCELASGYYITRLKRSCVDYILVRSPPEVRAQKSVCVKDDTIIQDIASLDHGLWFRFWSWYTGSYVFSQHLYHAAGSLQENAHQTPLLVLFPSFGTSQKSAQARFVDFVLERDEVAT
jgi:hypothetical protein